MKNLPDLQNIAVVLTVLELSVGEEKQKIYISNSVKLPHLGLLRNCAILGYSSRPTLCAVKCMNSFITNANEGNVS